MSKIFKKIVSSLKIATTSANAAAQIPRALHRLGITDKFVVKLASEILRLATSKLSRKPTTIIAASIYMACLLTNKPLTKKGI